MKNTQNLVKQHILLAKRMAHKIKRNLPSFIDIEDIESAAYLGLCEAASRFDFNFSVKFSTYAYPRIIGSIKDYLRSLGKDQCYDIDAENIDCLSKEDSFNREEAFEMFSLLSEGIDDQTRNVARNYFIDELSMKEVGLKFGLSEGRISQIISKFKNRINSKWSKRDLLAA